MEKPNKHSPTDEIDGIIKELIELKDQKRGD